MKKLCMYEPAMCCPSGLCGVGVDPELLRISTVFASLQKNGIDIQRYNLTNMPQEFINNTEVNQLLAKDGVEALPATVVDGKVVMTKRYPTNEELITMLNVPRSFLVEQPNSLKKANVTLKKPGGCGCSGGKCC